MHCAAASHHRMRSRYDVWEDIPHEKVSQSQFSGCTSEMHNAAIPHNCNCRGESWCRIRVLKEIVTDFMLGVYFSFKCVELLL